jgi:hypothetical protein
MNQSKSKRVARVWMATIIGAASASMVVAAGGEGGGHGGGGGGGGGGGHAAAPAAAPAGGGGGHVAAAPAAEHAAPAVAPHEVSSGTSTVTNARSSRPYNPYVPQASRTAAATQNPSVVTQGDTRAVEHRDHGDHERGRDHRNDNGYGVVYGYPWYPFSYGWGDGWYGGYGTQYGYPGYSYNSNYPFDIPYAEYNNDESLAANPPNSSVNQSQGTTPATTIVNPYDAQATQARETNAIEKSPAMIQANSTVAQTQSAYNTERERVLAALAQKPEYQAALARRHAAAKEVHAATTQPGGKVDGALVAAANKRMEAGDEVTKMEAQAVATDPAASVAKAKMEQAVVDRDALRAQLSAQQPQPR